MSSYFPEVATMDIDISPDYKFEFTNLPQEHQDYIRKECIYKDPIKIDFCFRQSLPTHPTALYYNSKSAFLQLNVFHFNNCTTCYIFLENIGVNKQQLRKIGFNIDSSRGSYYLTGVASALRGCTKLEELTIGVDEASMVAKMSKSSRGYQFQRQRPNDIPYSLNLAVLKFPGVGALRNLRFPKVVFTPFVHGRSEDAHRTRTTGPIPGGALETLVAKEMTACVPDVPKRLKRKAVVNDGEGSEKKRTKMTNGAKHRDNNIQTYFRLLDLPAELRNRVYHLALQIKGSINPSAERKPSTEYGIGKKTLALGTARYSALALLQANKQIYEEAVGIYYSINVFDFYFPIQSMMFLENLSPKRKSSIRSISLWHKAFHKQSKMDFFDFALLQLSNLPNLKKLEIVVDEHKMKTIIGFLGKLAEREGLLEWQLLTRMSKKGVEVKLRCPEADLILWHNFNEKGQNEVNYDLYRPHNISDAKKWKKAIEEFERAVTSTTKG